MRGWIARPNRPLRRRKHEAGWVCCGVREKHAFGETSPSRNDLSEPLKLPVRGLASARLTSIAGHGSAVDFASRHSGGKAVMIQRVASWGRAHSDLFGDLVRIY